MMFNNPAPYNMATSTIKSQNEKVTGTITKVVSGGTMDGTSLVRVGDTVFASGRIHSLANVATDQTFFQIPVGFRPKQSALVNGYASITNNGVATLGQGVYLVILTDGTVNLGYSSTATLTQIFFAGSWSVA